MNTITTNHKIHKLSKVPSGIAPAKQAWIPIRNNYSSIISAQKPTPQYLGNYRRTGEAIIRQLQSFRLRFPALRKRHILMHEWQSQRGNWHSGTVMVFTYENKIAGHKRWLHRLRRNEEALNQKNTNGPRNQYCYANGNKAILLYV